MLLYLLLNSATDLDEMGVVIDGTADKIFDKHVASVKNTPPETEDQRYHKASFEPL